MPKIIGILNVTPDSFFDGGRHQGEAAAAHLKRLMNEGAGMVDVGAESSRPGSSRISVEEEISRLRPLFDSLNGPHPAISIDTMKGPVARYALERGACVVNDISALRFDPDGLLKVLADFPQASLVLMHMKGEPETMQANPHYEDVTAELCSFFEERILFAQKNGISEDRIILDPGIGFGKRLEDNLELLAHLEVFKSAFGLPLWVGASRKSMIGTLLGGLPPQERLEGSLAVHLFCAGRVDALRVHDVAATARALAVWRALQAVRTGKAVL